MYILPDSKEKKKRFEKVMLTTIEIIKPKNL